jgi:general secretion pathway protein A
MVLDFYQLREQPFGVTPDPRYLYMGATHREAFASLLYGLDAGCGFVALIAEPGLGKTTLLFHTLDLLRDKVTAVFLSQNAHTPVDLLRAILAGMGAGDTGSNLSELQSRLDRLLMEQFRSGKTVVVVIDEAQNLNSSVLESVRMLSNFETSREKLVQIVLCGQPQLADKIAAPDLVQLRQRVSIFARLEPFSPAETAHYIQHRLKTAGYDPDKRLFDNKAEALIAKYSAGVPRNINNLCFNALTLGCAMKKSMIDAEIVLEVAADLDLKRWQNNKSLAARPTEADVKRGRNLRTPGSSTELNQRSMRAAILLALFIAAGLLALSQKWLPSKGAGLVTMQTSALHLTAGSGTASMAGARRGYADAPGNTSGSPPNPGPPLVTTPISSSSTTQGVKIYDYGTAVRVLSGRTLLGICIENFGKCDSKRLEELHLLNPRLKDLNHIEVGDRLLVRRVKEKSGSAIAGPIVTAPGTDGRVQ